MNCHHCHLEDHPSQHTFHLPTKQKKNRSSDVEDGVVHIHKQKTKQKPNYKKNKKINCKTQKKIPQLKEVIYQKLHLQHDHQQKLEDIEGLADEQTHHSQVHDHHLLNSEVHFPQQS
jgi:hypothetical protein